MREKHPKGMLYDSVLNFLKEYEGQERTLYHKLHGFIVLLNEMRDLAVYTPVHELILEILRRTGYGNYAKSSAKWCTAERQPRYAGGKGNGL